MFYVLIPSKILKENLIFQKLEFTHYRLCLSVSLFSLCPYFTHSAKIFFLPQYENSEREKTFYCYLDVNDILDDIDVNDILYR